MSEMWAEPAVQQSPGNGENVLFSAVTNLSIPVFTSYISATGKISLPSSRLSYPCHQSAGSRVGVCQKCSFTCQTFLQNACFSYDLY